MTDRWDQLPEHIREIMASSLARKLITACKRADYDAGNIREYECRLRTTDAGDECIARAVSAYKQWLEDELIRINELRDALRVLGVKTVKVRNDANTADVEVKVADIGQGNVVYKTGDTIITLHADGGRTIASLDGNGWDRYDADGKRVGGGIRLKL